MTQTVILALIHWTVVLIVAIIVGALAWDNRLDHASVTALYGTILGHAGTSAAHAVWRHGNNGQAPGG